MCRITCENALNNVRRRSVPVRNGFRLKVSVCTLVQLESTYYYGLS
jgi:hypothetical protein